MSLIRSWREFEAVHDEWNELADRHRHPLLWHEWLSSCARTLHAEHDLCVVVERNAGRLTAAAPLVARRRGGLRRLEFLGVRTLYEPCGCLFEDEAALDRLLHDVCSLGIPFAFDRLDAEAPTVGALKRVVGRRGLVFTKETSPSLALSLAADWETFVRALPAHLRSDLRRARHRAETLGPVSVEMFFPAPSDVDRLVETFAGVEAAGWKGRHGSALGQRDDLKRFFLEAGRRLACRGALRAGFLRIGPDLAAAQLAIEAYGAAWVLKVGYDERWARCSPGLELTGEAVKDAVSRGLSAYEFLGSKEWWEERWHPVARRYVLVVVYPASTGGAFAVCVDGLGWLVDHARMC